MRTEFSKLTRRLAFARANGKCEKCTARLSVGKFRFDHIIPDAFGGNNSFNNCQVICSTCDTSKTYGKDIPEIAKSNRIRDKHFGLKPKSSSFACGKNSKWKRKINGQVVLRASERTH